MVWKESSLVLGLGSRVEHEFIRGHAYFTARSDCKWVAVRSGMRG